MRCKCKASLGGAFWSHALLPEPGLQHPGCRHAGGDSGSLHSTFETLLLLESHLSLLCFLTPPPPPCLQCPRSFLCLPFLLCFKFLHRTHTFLHDLTPIPLSSLILCQSLFSLSMDRLPVLPISDPRPTLWPLPRTHLPLSPDP